MNRDFVRLISFKGNNRFLPRLNRGELLLPGRPRSRFAAFSFRFAVFLVRFAGSSFRFAAFFLGSGHICGFQVFSIYADLVMIDITPFFVSIGVWIFSPSLDWKKEILLHL